jgi:hypothetical protein
MSVLFNFIQMGMPQSKFVSCFIVSAYTDMASCVENEDDIIHSGLMTTATASRTPRQTI